MILDVPLIRQKENSFVCVLAALSMILHYHGHQTSIADLEQDPDARQTDMGAIGTYLLGNGFDVRVVMFHPRLFTNRDRDLHGSALIAHLRDRIGHPENMDWDDDVLRALIKFLEHGGELTIKIPELADIRQEIRAGRPVLVTTDTNFLYGTRATHFLHANVITGVDDEHIYVNDSLWDHRGGKHRYSILDYLFGIHMATHGNFNNGSLMMITPR